MALLDLHTGDLVPGTGDDDALLEPTADAATLAAAAATGGPIAIRFPTFGDGRGHSLAVLLRERHGFKGEIRAVGYLIPDLMRMLGGVPHGQHIVLGLVVGHDAAGLQRGWRQPLHAVALPDHVRGLRKGRLQVPAG